MEGGGSGAYFTMHVRFIVDPLLINKSGPPTISVTGSARQRAYFKGDLSLAFIKKKKVFVPRILNTCGSTEHRTMAKHSFLAKWEKESEH